jgi:hypothetical protein
MKVKAVSTRLRVRWTVTSSTIELKNNYYEANMTSTIETDIQKTKIRIADRGTEVRAELATVI